MNKKLKKFIKNHWDEVAFLIGICASIYFILKGNGYFTWKMMKKIIYIVGILSLGIVIFNNANQTIESIKQNINLMIGLIIALIMSVFYGIVNLKWIKWTKKYHLHS